MNRLLINGRPETQIPFSDRGLHYGDGLFETIALRGGRLQFWQAHLQRMQLGCQRLGLPAIETQQWLDDIGALDATDDAVIKLMLTRGSGGRGYRAPNSVQCTRAVAMYEMPGHIEARRAAGVKLHICKTPVSSNSQLAGIKHLNRLDSVLARNEWHDEEIAEGLMCDDLGHVIEGTMSNVFMVQNRILYTPILKKAGIEGIIRNRVIELAKQLGFVVQQIAMDRKRLMTMDEIFVTNSIIGIWPVIDIEGQHFKRGEVTELMLQHLDMNEGAIDVQTD